MNIDDLDLDEDTAVEILKQIKTVDEWGDENFWSTVEADESNYEVGMWRYTPRAEREL